MAKRTTKQGAARSGPLSPAREKKTSKAATLANVVRRGNKVMSADKTVPAIMNMGQATNTVGTRYTARIAVLDVALTGTVGQGLPGGRIVELFGDESVGKTTLCGNLIAEAQEQDGIGIMYDTESTFTNARAKQLGVNVNELLYGEHEYIEDILTLMHSNVVSVKKSRCVIVLDTIAGATSRREVGKRIGEGAFSPHASALSQGLRRLSRALARSRCLVVCVNQLKDGSIGVQYATERAKEATLGGKAIRFHASVRLRLKFARKFKAQVGKTAKMIYYGDEVAATVVKNKDGVSGTKASECILVLVKVGPFAGKFDNGLSALRTLQLWGVLPAGAKVKFNGRAWTFLQWSAEYANNESFRNKVNRMLEITGKVIREQGEAEKTNGAAIADDDDEEDLIV